MSKHDITVVEEVLSLISVQAVLGKLLSKI